MLFWLLIFLLISFAAGAIKFGYSTFLTARGTSTGNIGLIFFYIVCCIACAFASVGFGMWISFLR